MGGSIKQSANDKSVLSSYPKQKITELGFVGEEEKDNVVKIIEEVEEEENNS